MLSSISLNAPSVTPQMRCEQAGDSQSPLKGRACCNWQSTFLLLNLATLVAGVFFTFAMSFPLLALGLTAIGVLEVIIYHCATKNDAETPTVAEYDSLAKAHELAKQRMGEGLGKEERELLTRDKRDLERRLQETEEPLRELEKLRQDIEPLRQYQEHIKDLPGLRDEKQRLEREIQEKGQDHDQRNRDLQQLNSTIEKAANKSKSVAKELRLKNEEFGRAKEGIQEYAHQAEKLKEEIKQLEEKKRELSK